MTEQKTSTPEIPDNSKTYKVLVKGQSNPKMNGIYEMKESDLPPGLKQELDANTLSSPKCSQCKMPLSNEDLETLKDWEIKPEHFTCFQCWNDL